MSASIPYDILIEIIKVVAEDRNHQSLFELSLTCKSLLPLCRKHSFSVMTLVPRSWDSLSHKTHPRSFRLRSLKENRTLFRVKVVERLVESSPDILQYVRTLYILTHDPHNHDSAYLELLTKFNSLTFLSIKPFDAPYHNHYRPRQSWASLSSGHQIALTELIQQRQLLHLTFEGIGNIPPSILLPCRNLVHLSMVSSTFSSRDTGGFTAHIEPVQLKEMWLKYAIGGITPLIDLSNFGTSIIDLTCLEFLGIQLQQVLEDGCGHEILKDMSNLESLIISDPRHSYPTFLRRVLQNLHPHSYTTLTFLQYKIRFHRSEIDPNPLPSTVIQGLDFTSLERLEIFLDIQTPHYESHLLEDFRELDKILSTAQYSSLKTLAITCSTPDIDLAFDKWEAARKTHFPGISTNSSIDFTYTPFK